MMYIVERLFGNTGCTSIHTRVVTQNCSPAPSQSEAVIIGLETQTNPFSWKNLCVAYAKAFLTLVTYSEHPPHRSHPASSEITNFLLGSAKTKSCK